MDLNLIRVFVAVFESRTVTEAARRLHVTPSAVSQQLARLRQTLDDGLFQREGPSMLPTPVASKLYPAFRDALVGVETALGTVKSFDPATSARTFRIALSELGEIGWFPNFVSEISRTAPQVQIHSVALETEEPSNGYRAATSTWQFLLKSCQIILNEQQSKNRHSPS